MVDRITKNEEKFDKIYQSVEKLQESLKGFEKNKKDLSALQKYYGSDNWFKDKEAYEKNKIPKIKAGVLSEDGIWNMLSEIDEIVVDMKRIIANHERNK